MCSVSYSGWTAVADLDRYIGAALDRLRSFIDRHGDAGKKEINDVCTAHALTLDVNTEHDFLYNGCAVTPEGQLAILFNEDKLAVNIDDPLEEDKLAKALNSAPTAGAAMSYVARSSIENGWEKDAEETKKKFSDILQTEVALDPQFQQTHDALKASSEIELDRWEGNIGDFTRFYFEALANGLKSQNFDSDEMMREALVEALEKGRIAFRIVEKSQMKALYNECVFEDGILYMQVSKRTNARAGGLEADSYIDDSGALWGEH